MAWWQARRLLYLLIVLTALAFSGIARAADYRGQVTFGGQPLPGATVTVTQGTKKISAVSDQGGVYTLSGLDDGPAKLEIQMQCFSAFQADITRVSTMLFARDLTGRAAAVAGRRCVARQ